MLVVRLSIRWHRANDRETAVGIDLASKNNLHTGAPEPLAANNFNDEVFHPVATCCLGLPSSKNKFRKLEAGSEIAASSFM